MTWLLIDALACAIAGAAIGWPWGAVAAAGCLVLPVLTVTAMQRLAPARVYRDERYRRLKVVSVRVAPEVGAAGKALPAKAEDVTSK